MGRSRPTEVSQPMPTEDTNIGWTDDTWNPVHGCHKITEGCKNCYAAAQSQRFGHTEQPWLVQHADENIKLQDHHLDYPREKDPRRIFVNSMSDLFLPRHLLPDDYLHRIMDVIEAADQHVYQALTKHGTENGRLRGWDREYGRWPDNLWMGVTVETERRAYRMDMLRETGAATKWVSFEPLVGEVKSLGWLDGIDWVVVGGESGDPDVRREMDHAWARAIRDAARDYDIPYFFKQSSADYPETGRALAEEHASYNEARLQGGDLTEYRELPDALTPALAEARPDLVAEVV